MTRQKLLFNEYDVHQVCRGLPEAIKKAADELSDSELMDGTTDEVVDRLVAAYAIEVPILGLESVQKSQDEVEIDVSNDPRRFTFGEGPCYVKGTKVIWRVPFEGTPDLFHCRPSSYMLNGIHGKVDGHMLIIEVTRTDHDANAYKKEYDDTVHSIQSYLSTLRADTASLTDQLRSVAFARVQQRRDKRDRDQGLLNEL